MRCRRVPTCLPSRRPQAARLRRRTSMHRQAQARAVCTRLSDASVPRVFLPDPHATRTQELGLHPRWLVGSLLLRRTRSVCRRRLCAQGQTWCLGLGCELRAGGGTHTRTTHTTHTHTRAAGRRTRQDMLGALFFCSRVPTLAWLVGERGAEWVTCDEDERVRLRRAETCCDELHTGWSSHQLRLCLLAVVFLAARRLQQRSPRPRQ
mmetsp:Transcript_30761/g.73904  ORF Transcript_30761/g.73904 Transcript_30761/m.73904 type:complete len:207 (-) Transcript_30761:38-658(-)